MDPILARYASRPAPRYTSYPTAPHFSDAVGEEEVRRWLAKGGEEAVSLYVHVPFCRRMCWYCGCNMKLARRYQPVANYVESLLAEIALVAEAAGRRKVSHLHWGGGTPTSLEPEDLSRVMAELRRRYEVLEGAELALEIDPRTLTEEMARTLGRQGFTRASFGVQEFDARVQTAINRIQPLEMVAEAVGALRRNGLSEIGFDLIYGLPYQTVRSLVRTVRLAAEMAPGRVALFGYAHVPWMAKNQRMIPEEALPDAQARAEQAEAAAEELVALGYQRVGLDHFALPDDALAVAAREGRLRRNFQGYTTDAAETLIPFGASAIGRTPEGFWQNVTETGAWARSIAAGRMPVAKGVSVSADDQLRAWVIERLMCDFEVDLAAVSERFHASPDWTKEPLSRLEEMRADGLVEVRGTRVRMSEAGRPFVRIAASFFDAHFGRSQARHSVAI